MRKNLKPYLELMRMKNWLGYFLMASLGFVISRGFLFPLKDIIIFYTTVILLFGFVFSINDCFDTKEDKLDKDKKNPIVLERINLKQGLAFSVFLAISGLALSMVLGLKVFLLFFTTIVFAFLYSAPPVRMKGRPLLDLFSHGLFAGALIFLIPVLVFNNQLTFFHYLIAFSLFYFSITLEIRNHIEDYETDKKAGLKTTVGTLGPKNSEKLLRYLALIYPLTLFPIFLILKGMENPGSGQRPLFLSVSQCLLLFSVFTVFFIFFFLFRKNHKLVKNYRIMDLYANLSFVLVSILMIL